MALFDNATNSTEHLQLLNFPQSSSTLAKYWRYMRDFECFFSQAMTINLSLNIFVKYVKKGYLDEIREDFH